MKPGQRTVNELERAVLSRLDEGLEPERLHVLSRKYTGLGCFTEFRLDSDADGLASHIGLDGTISVPCLEYGLGAVLVCQAGRPAVLELFTYDEHWDGTFAGFTVLES